jgi:hypothetical protein
MLYIASGVNTAWFFETAQPYWQRFRPIITTDLSLIDFFKSDKSLALTLIAPPTAIDDLTERIQAQYPHDRSVDRCAGCHALMDGIGFGLEGYDARGSFRLHDEGKPECPIEGQGELLGAGEFSGPAELGALLSESGKLSRCLVERVYQLGVGRSPLPEDDAFLRALRSGGGGGAQTRLRELLLDWVSSEGFRTRIVDES